jgi:hypothetical protein
MRNEIKWGGVLFNGLLLLFMMVVVFLTMWIVFHPGIITFTPPQPTISNNELQATIQALQTLVPR